MSVRVHIKYVCCLSLSRRVKNAIKYLLFAVASRWILKQQIAIYLNFIHIYVGGKLCAHDVFFVAKTFSLKFMLYIALKRAFFISMLPLPLLWKRFSFSLFLEWLPPARDMRWKGRTWMSQNNYDNYGISWKIYWTPEVKRSL